MTLFAERYVYRIGVPEQVVQVSQYLLVGADQEKTELVLLPAGDTLCSGRKSVLPFSPTKLVTSPSESQVRSATLAAMSGFWSSLWMGMMGKSWSMAHESGSDWNREKLFWTFVTSME